MREAQARIFLVGQVETCHQVLDPTCTIHGQHLRAAGHHGLHPEFAEIADVVGVIVGDENPGDADAGKLHALELLPALRAGVDHIGLVASDDDRAGLGAPRIRKRRGRAAENDAHRLPVKHLCHRRIHRHGTERRSIGIANDRRSNRWRGCAGSQGEHGACYRQK